MGVCVNLIVAADRNWGIGKNNQLLYHIYPDMQFFMKKTKGGSVIMGRKTLESLPGGMPLKNRVNIILTRNPDSIVRPPDIKEGGLLICKDLDELARIITQREMDTDHIWVIGGAEIYSLLLPYCREAYVTRVLAADEEADCRMENLDRTNGWALIETGDIQEWEGISYRYDRYINAKTKVLNNF